MTSKLIIPLLVLITVVSCAPMSNNYGVYLAQINMGLPSLTFPFPNGDYIRMANGVMVEHKGPFVYATLLPRVVNGDFNNDGYADAAVIINVAYEGIGYFNHIVFAVLQDYTSGPKVTNGVIVGEVAVYTVPVFSSNVDNNKIIIQFMDRLPGQPKAVAPSVPTVEVLSVKGTTLLI